MSDLREAESKGSSLPAALQLDFQLPRKPGADARFCATLSMQEQPSAQLR